MKKRNFQTVMSIIRQVDFHESFDGIHLGKVRVTHWSNLSPSVIPSMSNSRTLL
jgi:hypothetical protein